MRLIDADALMLHLADYELQESPYWGANGHGNETAYLTIKECEKAVEEQPTIDAVSVEWIPCSERLPTKSESYLVTVPIDDDRAYVDALNFHKGKFYECDSEWGDIEYDDVIAWMPLPKPYGERSDT